MADLNGFNANNVEPSSTFEAIPAGNYIAAIIASETKPTKNGGGSYLQLSFQILEGEYKGRLLWARLNLNNANALTVQIARAELSAICRAAGIMTPKDSVELHNLPMQISVKCRKRQDTGEITNEIRGYAKRDAASGVPQQQVSGLGEVLPPWKR